MSERTTLLVPHLVCRDAPSALKFYERAFGAEVLSVQNLPDGRVMHAALAIDGSPVYLVEEFPEWGGASPQALGGTPVTIHLQVADCDAVFGRAVEAGCTVVMPLDDMFWGDRYGIVADPYGHKWSVATAKAVVAPDEITATMAGTAG